MYDPRFNNRRNKTRDDFYKSAGEPVCKSEYLERVIGRGCRKKKENRVRTPRHPYVNRRR